MCVEGLVLVLSASRVSQWGCLRVRTLPMRHRESFHFLRPSLSLVLGPRLEDGRFS